MIQVFKPNMAPGAADAVAEVLKSGWVGCGPKVKEFEAAFANYIGQDGSRVVALNSCTAALHLALVLEGVGVGDEVITTANTFVSTNHAILYTGAKPVFCDVKLETGNIDVNLLEPLITEKTKAIIVVHYGGYPCDLFVLDGIRSRHNVAIIEDCAHACGAKYYGQSVGTMGDFGCFSLQAVKNLPVGDGGMLMCDMRSEADKARKMRWLGIDKDTYSRGGGACDNKYAWQYDVPHVGYKYHMNDISAAIGLEQLKVLGSHNAIRRMVAKVYEHELRDVPGVTLPEYDTDNRKSAYHFYPILVDNRDGLIIKLKEHDIHPGVHYMRNDAYDVYDDADLPNTHVYSEKELTLPIHTLLSFGDAAEVISVLKGGW